jgi:hypothetical protein
VAVSGKRTRSHAAAIGKLRTRHSV